MYMQVHLNKHEQKKKSHPLKFTRESHIQKYTQDLYQILTEQGAISYSLVAHRTPRNS